MLRVLLAAVAGGIALQLWVIGSSYWLPRCMPAAPTPPLATAPPLAPTSSAGTAPAIAAETPTESESPIAPGISPAVAAPSEAIVVVDTATPVITDTPQEPAPLPPLPDRTNRAPVLPQLFVSLVWRNVGVAFLIGLIAALMAVALPAATPVWRQWSLVLLVGLFTALIGRAGELAAANKSPLDLFACIANHFGGVVIVATVAAAIARCRWLGPKPSYSRTSWHISLSWSRRYSLPSSTTG